MPSREQRCKLNDKVAQHNLHWNETLIEPACTAARAQIMISKRKQPSFKHNNFTLTQLSFSNPALHTLLLNMSASDSAPASSAMVGGIQTGQAPGAAYTSNLGACAWARYGCRDPNSANYQADATHSHPSVPCVPTADACLHPSATNYNVLTNQSEQSDRHYYTDPLVTGVPSLCEFLHAGCMSSQALNGSQEHDIHDESQCVYANVSACFHESALNHSGPASAPAAVPAAAPAASCDDK